VVPIILKDLGAFKTMGNAHPLIHHISQDLDLNVWQDHCENLKSCKKENMKVELCGHESPPLYPVPNKSFASRFYFNKFYYESPGCVWECCFILHPGMDTSLLTCSGHMTFSTALLNGHYCCVACGREDAVV